MDFNRASESSFGKGERFDFEGQIYSRSMLNYLRALNLLKKNCDTSKLTSCLEIGGGYGTLGEIFLKAQENSIYVNVDIPPVAAVSTWYLSEVFGNDKVLDYSDSYNMTSLNLDELRGKYKAIVLCPWQLPLLEGEFDLFANFMSFQEMEPDVVTNYISLVQPLIAGYALIRNSALGKKVVKKAGDIGVFEAVVTDFIVNEFNELGVLARDSIAHGEKSEDASYCSEVLVLKR
jgi:putative sugar O-methyltransferase